LPHHITQRGNRREDVFFDDKDRETYLQWLGEYAAKFKVEVAAWC
jgi:putative transposase